MLETSQLAAADLVARRAKEFLAVLDGCDDFDNALQAYSNLRSALETYAELRVDCAVLEHDPQRMIVADWAPAPITERSVPR